jgi:Ca2+/Na+ antiporter
MKKILFILVLVFSLFFAIYGLDQSEISLYQKWGVLLAWFVFIKILEKALFKEEEEEDEEELEEELEDEQRN